MNYATLGNIFGGLALTPIAGLLLWTVYCTLDHFRKTTRRGRWSFLGAVLLFLSVPIILMGSVRALIVLGSVSAMTFGIMLLATFFSEN